jgi:excisionase family DNA binding protein
MTKKPEAERLLTPKEAAAYLGLNPRTVTRIAQAGKLRSYPTDGGQRRFKLADVLALRDRRFEELHQPYPHGGVMVCGLCSRAAGQPVPWAECKVAESDA